MKPYTVTILQGGKRVNQTVLAASPDDASARIIAGGGIGMQVEERPARKEKRFPLNLFLQELIALLEAGLVVDEAVGGSAGESSRDGGTSLVLDTLVKKLYEGAQLSQAMMALPALFPDC